jgi:hypothetical protein
MMSARTPAIDVTILVLMNADLPPHSVTNVSRNVAIGDSHEFFSF